MQASEALINSTIFADLQNVDFRLRSQRHLAHTRTEQINCTTHRSLLEYYQSILNRYPPYFS